MREIKVIGWTNASDDKYPNDTCRTKEIQNAIIKEILKNNYDFSGMEHISEKFPCTPVLNNGVKISISARAWGSLMAYAYNINNEDGMAYMNYFLIDFFKESKIPPAYVDRKQISYFEIPSD